MSEKDQYEQEKEPYVNSEKDITTGQPKLLSEAGEPEENVHKKPRRRRIIILLVVALVVIVAAVVGGVVGSRRSVPELVRSLSNRN